MPAAPPPFPPAAEEFWLSVSDHIKPHFQELIKSLFSINIVLKESFPEHHESFSFISALKIDITKFIAFIKDTDGELDEKLMKQLRKDAANLLKKVDSPLFKKKPEVRAKSQKSTMISISKKLKRIMEEKNDKKGKRMISFDIFSAINGAKLDRVTEFVERNPKILQLGDDVGNLPIHHAVNKNQIEIVKYILKADPTVVESCNKNGLIPLELAILNNEMELVKIISAVTASKIVDLKYVLHCDEEIREYLLKTYGERINEPCPDRDRIKNKTKQTPMHKVSAGGRSDVLMALLNNGGDPNVEDINGNKPLHCAATFNNSNCVRTLVSKGADVDGENILGDTSLMAAVSVSDKDTVQTLIDAGADINLTNHESESPALLAVARESKEDKQEILSALIKHHADLDQQDDKGYSPLLLACAHQDTLSINQLLDAEDIDVDIATADGFTPLTFSAVNNDLATAEKLVAKDADLTIVTLEEKSPLHYATSVPMVDLLVGAGADINSEDENKQTPLYTYIQGVLSEVAVHAIDIGASIDHEAEGKTTPLQESAKYGNEVVAAAILNKAKENGENIPSFVNQSNVAGSTAMHQVCSNNHPGTEATFSLLLDNGASLQATDIFGNLPVHHAARTNNPNLPICLEKNPASVNAQNEKLNTPLHLAADAGHENAVDTILKTEGINFEVKNDRGMVASESTGNPEISQNIALQRMTSQYQAQDGELAFGLKWFDWNDLDIHLFCSCGEEISFRNKKCFHCELDVDMNVDGDARKVNDANSDQAVEHITFPKMPLDGGYTVVVNLYSVYDTSVEKCDYSLFMVQKDEVTHEPSLVFFVKSSFDVKGEKVEGANQFVCEFVVSNGKITSLSAPEGKVYVNKLQNVSIPLDYQGSLDENHREEDTVKFLPELRCIAPKMIEDD